MKCVEKWLKKTVLFVMKCLTLPKHIAFIMDGNRRFAKRNNSEPLCGHQKGYKTLLDVLKMCFELKICHITVFAFGVSNFKRDKSELEGLMNLAECCVETFNREYSIIERNGVQFNLFGDMSILFSKLEDKNKAQNLALNIDRLVKKTKDNNRFFLNVCFSYSSQLEMIHGIGCLCQLKISNILTEDDVDFNQFSRVLHTKNQPEPDLLVRTSGETRLSDFLLFQLKFTPLFFSKVMWPDFDEYQMLKALLFYGRQRSHALIVQQMFNDKMSEEQKKSGVSSSVFTKSLSSSTTICGLGNQIQINNAE